MKVCDMDHGVLAGHAHSSSLPTDAASQLDIFGHDGDTLGMDGTEVSVLEQANQIGLRSFL